MFESIFKKQLDSHEEIQKIIAQLKELDDWDKSKKAFDQIVHQYLHDSPRNKKDTSTPPKLPMAQQELDSHFERALVITQDDIKNYHQWIQSLIQNDKNLNSPYYLVNVEHHRRDEFYKKDQPVPLTGGGTETLNAKFEAHNIYKKYNINATSSMPDRVQQTPKLATWDAITNVMKNKDKFQELFGFADPKQENETFDIVSNWDWNKVQGKLFLTPDMAHNNVFSPALFSVYFFGADENAPMNIFMIVSANGNGDPTAKFLGIVNAPGHSKENVFRADSRYAFTHLSSKANPMNYWMDMRGDAQEGFVLGMQTFFPKHPKKAYIEVISDFCAQVPKDHLRFYQRNPFLKTFLMLVKGTLMRDLIKAYYPNESSLDLWIQVGAIQRNQKFKKLIAKILDGIASIFDFFVW